MSWLARILLASWVSPSGATFSFSWTQADENIDKNIATYRFPFTHGIYAQDLGTGGARYPMTLYISGADYDVKTAALVAALSETGGSLLNHPVYGTKTVMVAGIKRADTPTTRGNQAVLTVEFLEYREISYPSTLEDAGAQQKQASEDLDFSSPDGFNSTVDYTGANEKNNAANRLKDFVNGVGAAFDKITGTVGTVNDAFNTAQKLITNNIAKLIGNPIMLAAQINALLKQPAKIAQSASLQLKGYKELTGRLFAPSNVVGGATRDGKNANAENTFLIIATMGAAADALVNATYETQEEGLQAVEELRELYEEAQGVIEGNEKRYRDATLALLDFGSGDTKIYLDRLIQLTCARLNQITLNLPKKITFTTETNRSLIELVYELYNSVDDKYIDGLIKLNNLQGDEMILISKGTKITYYRHPEEVRKI